ncbi:hypothetical protein P154DRAFT_524512 [Amniculicola lignicola CBS 123094]|uniref:Uncharacterized protein n=1 Tax=Amniculicola lignicola CBS 123094 TaxID=1392246 RepID=A0A6A5W747_9PLEO|nr:hypothetical protein P154DRAFT_524512 [Amniculicola lignicola CBS 123094]
MPDTKAFPVITIHPTTPPPSNSLLTPLHRLKNNLKTLRIRYILVGVLYGLTYNYTFSDTQDSIGTWVFWFLGAIGSWICFAALESMVRQRCGDGGGMVRVQWWERGREEGGMV